MGRAPIPELTRLEHVLLSALASQERYGLEIIEAVEKATGGRLSISLGSLYTTLHRIEKKGLVASRWGETAEGRQGARRRYYKVTGLGSRALAADRETLRRAWRLAPMGVRFVMEGA